MSRAVRTGEERPGQAGWTPAPNPPGAALAGLVRAERWTLRAVLYLVLALSFVGMADNAPHHPEEWRNFWLVAAVALAGLAASCRP